MYRTVFLLGVFVAALLAISTFADAEPLRVGLDFFPNPNHVPIYAAAARGLFEAEGLDVEIIVPANPSDPVKLAASGWLDVALTPQINYMIARSEGLPLVAIGALIDHGLGGLLSLAGSAIERIEDLAGSRIGYSLAPLEPILWETMLGCANVPIESVELVNVGYSTMPALLSGSVDAIGAFRTFEPIQAEMQGFSPIFFPQEEYCIPWTYDIILVAHPQTVIDRASELAALLDVLSGTVRSVQSEPDRAFADFIQLNPDLDDELNRRSFDVTIPLFAGGLRHDDEGVWTVLQAYLFENELIESVFTMSELYTTELLPTGARGEDE